jgi:hypothetical protein
MQVHHPSGYWHGRSAVPQALPCCTDENVGGHSAGFSDGVGHHASFVVVTDQRLPSHVAIQLHVQRGSPPYSHSMPFFEQALPSWGCATGQSGAGVGWVGAASGDASVPASWPGKPTSVFPPHAASAVAAKIQAIVFMRRPESNSDASARFA